jgi:hypothetical protein
LDCLSCLLAALFGGEIRGSALPTDTALLAEEFQRCFGQFASRAHT